ncbi:MAG: hypothetical protein ACO3O0_08625 [Bacteroidia bacterium]
MIDHSNDKKSWWALCIALATITFTNYHWFPGNILSWDVFGYYLYLPLSCIHDNLDLHDVGMLKGLVEKYQSSSTLYQAYETQNGQWVLRYPMGLAILYLPFFLLGHVFALFSGYEADGFSIPYQFAILTAGIVYTFAGLFVLRLSLKRYFNDSVVAIGLLCIVFGTNYFWHVGFHGSNAMSHNYLFSLYAFLIFFTIRLYERFCLQRMVWVALVGALILLCRPSELVCLWIPALWGVSSLKGLRDRIALWISKWSILVFGAVLAVLIGSIQLCYWKWITGSFFFYSYGDNPGEGFQFLEPNLLEVLFSYRKGWLLYTPLMGFSILGIWIALKKRMEFGASVLLYFLLNLFIVASWSCWWYAESFSQRSLVQSYALLAFPLCAFYSYGLYHSRRLISVLILAMTLLLVSFNLFQTWQFKNGLIHPSRMTKQAYWKHFLTLEYDKEFDQLLMLDRDGFNPDDFSLGDYFMTKKLKADIALDTSLNQPEVNGQQLSGMDAYSKAIELPLGELMQSDHAVLKVTMQVSISDTADFAGSLVCAAYHNGWSYGYKSLDLESSRLRPNLIEEVRYTYLTPVIRSSHDIFKIYYWSRCEKSVVVHSLTAEVWERQP